MNVYIPPSIVLGGMSFMIFLICLIAFVKSVKFVIYDKSPLKFYVIGKYIVVGYLGTLYGILAFDRLIYDIIEYPQWAYLLLLRVAAFLSSVVFLTDAFMRGKS